MKINDLTRIIEDLGFHIERIENIERGIRIFVKENFYIDIMEENNEWILYYVRKVDCKNLHLIREKIKKRNQEILNKGYIAGICFLSNSCNVVVVKKLKNGKDEKLWDEYFNMIKVADLVA
ncbi:MAG: hypothetical protein OWQ47_03180 [Acidianus infernus]|uniref:hypothetical protein n=1 Tax=Acidianus infernus TaxID=12915 RepID=UPI002276E5C3|nr:hypothetical protein [Acidianus infernus]